MWVIQSDFNYDTEIPSSRPFPPLAELNDLRARNSICNFCYNLIVFQCYASIRPYNLELLEIRILDIEGRNCSPEEYKIKILWVKMRVRCQFNRDQSLVSFIVSRPH